LFVAGVTFDNRSQGQDFAVCLIGSKLKALYWSHRAGDSDDDVAAFFDGLATTPSKISLDVLMLTQLSSRGAGAMALFLPLSTSL
jgi:hypothetical protein